MWRDNKKKERRIEEQEAHLFTVVRGSGVLFLAAHPRMKGGVSKAALAVALACMLGLAVAAPSLQKEGAESARMLSMCAQQFVDMSDEDLFE